MIKKIYLILGGEDENKRPRTKKLLDLIRNDILNNIDYKIIISGFSWFNLNSTSSESSRIRKYLIEKNISEKNIILEEESLDTLGNMIFSHIIIEKLIRENLNDEIEIILITEGFHMKRSKELFLRIFKDIKYLNNKISFKFESANSLGISSFYWKRKLKVIVSKIKRRFELDKNTPEYFKKIFLINKKYLFNFIILDIILTDFDFFKLKTFEDYEDFLFSLPVYNQKYKPKKKYLIQFSIYGNLIKYSNKNK
jgi:uncharacterized SAM-binding protein YcdF (DUF218 family)